MPVPQWPSTQPYVHADYSPGEPALGYQDPITKHIYKIGQISPQKEESWFMQHGRNLAGLGSNETQASYQAIYQDEYMRDLESEDDTFGSGVFDTYGRSATVHPNLGVFADHPSLPGYIEREVQYAVSTDVADLPAGADIVVVPGGGMTFMERDSYPVPFDRFGPTPCPPELRPPPMTSMQEVYASLSPQTKLNAGASPKLLPPSAPAEGLIALKPGTEVVGIPDRNSGYEPRSMGILPRVPHKSIVNTAVEPWPVGKLYNPPILVRSTPMYEAGARQTVNVDSPGMTIPAPYSIRAMGQTPEEDKKKAGWGTYLFAGLLVGASAAMLFGATKKPSRGRR